MDRIRRSWELAKASYAVLKADRELLVFPMVSFVALVAILIAFAVPFMAVGFGSDRELNAAGGVLLFLFYVVSYSVGFFFNTALVGAAMIRLNGGDPTVSDGMRVASSRLPQIVGYAVIAATVGMILRALSERAGFLGQIVISLIGFAWTLATFLVVPILAVEGVGPLAAVKRSTELLKKTWGEQVIGNVGIGLVFTLLIVGVVVIGGALAALLASVSGALAIVAIVATILVVAALALVSSALGGIYTASLYRYATQGSVAGFDAATLSAAFRAKS